MTRKEIIAVLQRMAAWGGPDGDNLNEAIDMLEADGDLIREVVAADAERAECAHFPNDLWARLQAEAGK